MRLDHAALTQAIYDIADDAEGWPRLLAAVSEAFGAMQAHLFLVAGDGALLETHHHGPPSVRIADYHEHYQQQDPRLSIALRSPDQVFSDVAVIEPAAFEKTAIYNEYLAPNDIRYSLFVNLRIANGMVAPHGFFRPARDRPFEPDEVEAFSRLLPHIRRATWLRELLREARGEIADLQGALDLVPAPVAVLDEASRVVCASRSAESLLRRDDGLLVRNRRLTAALPVEAAALEDALANAVRLSRPGAETRPPPVVFVSRAIGPRLSLAFLPLRGRHTLRIRPAPGARVLAVVHDPSMHLRLDPAVVAQVHSLTATEALLATWVAEGRTLAEFARERGSSEQTARTHMKRILEKTGTGRQADLVRVLLTTIAGRAFAAEP